MVSNENKPLDHRTEVTQGSGGVSGLLESNEVWCRDIDALVRGDVVTLYP